MKQYKNQYAITKIAKILGVSRSGYYAWEGRKESRHAEEDRFLAELIKQIFDDHYGRYGSPCIWHELRSLGWRVSRKRVERLMREQKMQSRRQVKWVKTTDTNHKLQVSDNIRAYQIFCVNEKYH